jgi:glutamine phosphoribosylpyrophosphate amidotransferase
MLSAARIPSDQFCAACFSGTYPLPTNDRMENKYRLGAQQALLEELAGY